MSAKTFLRNIGFMIMSPWLRVSRVAAMHNDLVRERKKTQRLEEYIRYLAEIQHEADNVPACVLRRREYQKLWRWKLRLELKKVLIMDPLKDWDGLGPGGA